MLSADDPAMPAPTGDSDCGSQLEPFDLEMMEQPAEQPQLGVVAQLAPMAGLDASPVSSETMTIRRSSRGRIVQRARRLIAAFSVCAPS